jgi:hypothetical protein
MKLKRYIFTVVLFTMLIGCSEEFNVEPFTYPQAFTGEEKKAWTVRSIQLQQTGQGTVTFNLSGCALDDIYIFHNNAERSYQVTEGVTKCSPDDPNLIVEDSWSFVNTSATLTIIMPLLSGSPLPFTLKEVDAAKMVIDIYLNDKTNYRINFKPASVE